MSLKSIPVATDKVSFVAIDSAEVYDYREDGTRSDRQRTDADGRLVYRLNCLALVAGETGGEVVAVRISLDDVPNITPLSSVKFSDLVAKPWTQGDRSGVALVASGVQVEDASPNGRARKPEPQPEQAAA